MVMAERHPQIKAFLDALRERAEMADPTARMLLEGSDHPYDCRCDNCLEWWAAVGPEYLGDGRYGYGPFSEQDIEAARKGEI
jgi:hypothetical protein